MEASATRTHRRRYTQLPRFFRWFSQQCVLRQLDESDVKRLTRTVTGEGFSRCVSGPAPGNVHTVTEYLLRCQADWRSGARYALAVLRKLSHEFVGWVEARPVGGQPRTWSIDAFMHPDFIDTPLAQEAWVAAADLLFSGLDAQSIFARCPAGNRRLGELLKGAGFSEVAPPGSRDPVSGRLRTYGLFELAFKDWEAVQKRAVTNREESAGNGWRTGRAGELSLDLSH